MKAYFIGGSHDLSVRNIEDDGERILHIVKYKKFPIPAYDQPFPTMCTIETELYHKMRWCMSDGEMIMVCFYEKPKDKE